MLEVKRFVESSFSAEHFSSDTHFQFFYPINRQTSRKTRAAVIPLHLFNAKSGIASYDTKNQFMDKRLRQCQAQITFYLETILHLSLILVSALKPASHSQVAAVILQRILLLLGISVKVDTRSPVGALLRTASGVPHQRRHQGVALQLERALLQKGQSLVTL